MELRYQNGVSISKWIELQFQNGASVSKSNFNFQMELSFENRASISKWSFNIKMALRFRNGLRFQNEFRFQNGASISKWSFDFRIVIRLQNGASISKWSFNFNLNVFHVTFCTEKRYVIWVECTRSCTCPFSGFYCDQSSSLADQRRERNRKWWNETISKGGETSV